LLDGRDIEVNMKTVELDFDKLAKKAAGNHKKFESFMWWDHPEDENNWTLLPLCNRDSGLLEQSNAAAMQEELKEWMEGDEPDVLVHRMNHWAVGWADQFAIRVYRDGEVTAAFKRWCELHDFLESTYACLDESDYSRREYEASLENLKGIVRSATGNLEDRGAEVEVPNDGGEGEVYSWLSDNTPNGTESRDDQGAWPDEELVEEALEGLGWVHWPNRTPEVGVDDLVTTDEQVFYQGGLVVLTSTGERWREDIAPLLRPGARVWLELEGGDYERLDVG
jgi:hypothetical protein